MGKTGAVGLGDDRTALTASAADDSGLLAEVAARYFDALLAGDRNAAVRAALDDGIARGLSVPDLYLGVIQPAQHRVGELWQENRITVAHEHVATAISQLVMALAYPSLPREPFNGKRVLVACVGDELHDLGARMVADFFEMAGFDIRYLGANLPTSSLVSMVREEQPDLVVLSVTMAFHIEAARETVARLREAGGDGLRVALGGQAFAWSPELPAQFGADVHGRTAFESVAAAREVLGLVLAP
jgi:MerR family transcriptional regulator, light-induced transcriptional regulator